jgi:hypothetical protein
MDIEKIKRSFLGKSIFENLGLKIFSLIFALVLWFFVSGKGRSYTEISYSLPLEFKNIPSELVITNDFKDKVEVRLSGPTTLLNTVRTEKLKYTIDLHDITAGESSFSINPENIDLLRGLKITKISPSKINLVIENIINKTVPVVLKLTGELSEGYKVISQKIEPASVEIAGAESEIITIQSLPTEVDLRGQKTTIKQEVDIIFKDIFYSEVVGNKNIVATIEIAEEVLDKEFKGIDVKVMGVEGETYKIKPKKIDVVINGTYLNFKEFKKESIVAFINATDVPDEEPQILKPEFELPPDFTVKVMNPETFKVLKVVKKGK